MRIAAMWPCSYKQGVVIMRQPGLPLVIAMLVLTAACSNDVPVGPTSSPAPPNAGLAQPVPDVPGQPPYTVTGTVLDSRGAPVAGAEIWIYGNDSPIDNRYGVSFADDAGRYRVTSTARVPHTVRAMKDGYVRRDVPIRVSSTSPWVVDVRLQHIDRYQLIGPSDIVTGESSRLQARVDLDDGSTETGFL